MKMKGQSIIGIFLIVTSGVAGAKLAAPFVVDAGSQSMTATVVDIDHEARTVTLEDPSGNMLTMQVGPEAARFNEIEKGDKVKVDYLESVAVAVASPGEADPSVQASESFVVRNPGKKPSGTAVKTDVVTATVEKIDAKERIATLKGPEGEMLNVSIAPDVPVLPEQGDQVVVKVTRSLALDITSQE
jgi:hypothetical protein